MTITLDDQHVELPADIRYYGQLRDHVPLPPQVTLWDHTDAKPRFCPNLMPIRDQAVLKTSSEVFPEEPI